MNLITSIRKGNGALFLKCLNLIFCFWWMSKNMFLVDIYGTIMAFSETTALMPSKQACTRCLPVVFQMAEFALSSLIRAIGGRRWNFHRWQLKSMSILNIKVWLQSDIDHHRFVGYYASTFWSNNEII